VVMMMRVDEEPVHWGRTVAHPNDGGKTNPTPIRRLA
jgi:hypothetical protein